MEAKYYSAERNVQIIISLLKQHGIRKVVASPGTTNMPIVASMQHDPWFEMISCVDERSAAYMACGLAAESGEPVVITCTGATASRDYMPAITEAHYRKLPVLAITGARDADTYGHLNPQTINRLEFPADTYVCSVHLQRCKDEDDAWGNTVKVNRAILALTHNGGGPAHINCVTLVSGDYSAQTLPEARAIFRLSYFDTLPQIGSKNRIAVYVGNHPTFTASLTEAVDAFCEKYGAVVFCDNTSGYNGRFKVLLPLLSSQSQRDCAINHVDLIVHIGEVSGSYMKAYPSQAWRVSPDGELRDHFHTLKYVFQTSEEWFFRTYAVMDVPALQSNFLAECRAEEEMTRAKIDRNVLPFSNIWMASTLAPRIPGDSNLHVGILNSLRSWNYFPIAAAPHFQCNTGGFGIDGPISTAIGASLADTSRLTFLVVGDLAFFYDLNALGNHYIRSNLRILLVNNGEGIEFKNYLHPAFKFGDAANEYFAARGHFGAKSPTLVRDFATDLGFDYRAATDKASFEANLEWFTSPEPYDRPLLLEAFTDEADENASIHYMNTLNSSAKGVVKTIVKKVLPESAIRSISERKR